MSGYRWSVIGVLLLFAIPLNAQVDHYSVGFRLGIFEPNAGNAFDAVYGDPIVLGGVELGFGFEHGWFLRLSADNGEISGEQVVLMPDPVPTGFEATFRLLPVHLTGGKTFGSGRWRFDAGLGPTYVSWEEEGEFESASDSNVGGHISLGVGRTYAEWRVGGALVYSIVPDAIGKGGASEQFDEEDIGGVALMFRVSRTFD